MALQSAYRIRIRRFDLELEVEGPDAAYVDSKLAELLDWFGFDGPEGLPAAAETPPNASKPVSLVEHVRKIDPKGGLEHVLAVGYYLERHRAMRSGFRRRDLSQAFQTLKYNHSNPGVPIASGRKQGLLIEGDEEDKIRLSESADRWVEARLSEE